MKKLNNLIFDGITIESDLNLKKILNLLEEFKYLTGGQLPANYFRFNKNKIKDNSNLNYNDVLNLFKFFMNYTKIFIEVFK